MSRKSARRRQTARHLQALEGRRDEATQSDVWPIPRRIGCRVTRVSPWSRWVLGQLAELKVASSSLAGRTILLLCVFPWTVVHDWLEAPRDECLVSCRRACGVLAHGLLRVRCDACGHDRLVAFSCKDRGIGPSCGDRRMVETAAHLVDRVLPDMPIRQWLVTSPYRLRYRYAWNAGFTGEVLRAVLRADFSQSAAGVRSPDSSDRSVSIVIHQTGGLRLGSAQGCGELQEAWRLVR